MSHARIDLTLEGGNLDWQAADLQFIRASDNPTAPDGAPAPLRQ